MSKSKIFLYILLCFIMGVAIRSFFRLPFLYCFIFAMFCLVFLIIFWENKKIRLVSIGGIFLFLGILRFELTVPNIDLGKIQFYNGEKTIFTAIVDKRPDVRIDHTRLTVESKKIKLGRDEIEVSGKVLVKTKLYPEYFYGDILEINCKLVEPEPIEDFSYDKYLARYDIYSLCYSPKIKILERGKGNIFWSTIYKIKDKTQLTINKSLSEPAASIFSAMVLGNRRGIPQDLIDDFSKTGISHIIAISGMHITIVAGILMSIFLGFSLHRKKAFYFASIGLFLFIILVGMPSSAVRAGTMGFLVLLALNVGRVSSLTNSLAFVASLILLFNPLVLRYDVGFQLSFLAVLSLMYFSDFFEDLLEKIKIPKTLGLRGSLNMTLSAQVLTLPIIAYNFKRVSIISPLANILVVPLLPFIIILGFLATLPGFVFTALSNVLFWPVWLLLSYLTKVVEFLSSLSFSYFEIEYIPWYLVVLIYAVIFAWIYMLKLKKEANS